MTQIEERTTTIDNRTSGNELATLPRRSLLAVAAAGVGFAAWMPESGGPGIFLLLVAIMSGLAVVFAGGLPRTPASLAFGAVAVILVAMTSVSDAIWLVLPGLLLALVFAALAVRNPRSWSEALTGALSPAARLPRVPGALIRSTSAAVGSANHARTASLLRGLVIGGVLVAIFWGLFASADRAFAQLTENLFPDWDLGRIPDRLFLFAVACAITTAFVLAGTSKAPQWLENAVGRAGSFSFKLGRTEWIAILGLLNALFLAFTIVQVLVLIQGHDHILETAGLTYAEYARQGFSQLIFAVALTIPVVCLTWAHATRQGASDEMILKVLLGLLCVLTLGIVFSALRRLGLYEEAFGFTRARLAAHALALWLAAVLLAMLVTGAAGRTRWLFYTTVALTAVAVLGLNFMNPDAAIARRNWERFQETGKLDNDYLADLSTDAVPFLADLPDDGGREILEELSKDTPKSEPWSSANLSRIRARSILKDKGLL